MGWRTALVNALCLTASLRHCATASKAGHCCIWNPFGEYNVGQQLCAPERDLAWNEEYRLAFADRVHKHFFNDGVFTERNSLVRMNDRSVQIRRAIYAELARWGGTPTKSRPA